VAKPDCVLFLLDWRPAFWSTREEYYRQLCQLLSGRGLVPILTISEPPDDATRRRLEDAGARVVACSYHASPLAYWAHIRRIARDYNLRIAHVRFFDYFTAVFWMCRIAGIRNVCFTEANSGEWKTRGWKAALIRLRTRAMCRPLTRAIAISEFIRDRLIAVGIPSNRTAVIHNGVDLESFQPDAARRAETRRETHADAGTVVLMFASVLLPWKRPDVVLRVCADLVARGIDVQLWMAGLGPLRVNLEALGEELGVASRVRWLGYQNEMAKWYASADVFVHTALGEAFGNVLIEAMACGLPVAATSSGALPELIGDGETGYLVAAGVREVQEMADAIQSIISDRERYHQMSQAAIRQARRFPLEDCVAKTWEIYKPILKQ